MSLIAIRKRSLTVETIYHEGGPEADTPLRVASACAVIRNPYAGRYEPDLLPFMAELRSLGTMLAEELVSTQLKGYRVAGELADWIRFKLDQRLDHLLIDEAQDTNQSQWDIVEALIDDFFAGEGARADKLRTIFTVGDYKQAIFGFQGTSPENFARVIKPEEKQLLEAVLDVLR